MIYMKVRKIFSVPALFLSLLFFVSCFGFDAEIEIRENGAVLNLEYRVSSRLEETGKLDGNEQWPMLPAGRRDFERTAARLKGTHLKSFSSKITGNDLVTRVSLEFDSIETLVSFLDAAGEDVSYTTANGKNVLSMTLLRAGGAPRGGEDRSFITAAFEGYAAVISLKSPGAAVVPTDGGGKRIDIPGASVTGGGASFSVPMGDLLSFGAPVALEFTW